MLLLMCYLGYLDAFCMALDVEEHWASSNYTYSLSHFLGLEFQFNYFHTTTLFSVHIPKHLCFYQLSFFFLYLKYNASYDKRLTI